MFREQFAPIVTRVARATGAALLVSGLALSALAAPVGAQSPVLPQAPYRLSVSDVALLEGNSGQSLARFTVTLSRPGLPFVPPPGQVFVQYNTISGTANRDVDYVHTAGSLLFEPLSALQPSATQQVVVPVIGDLADESDETFTLRLFNQTDNAELADADGLGTIRDDDQALVSIRDASLSEPIVVSPRLGVGEMVFTVTLSEAVGEDVRVSYITENGSAVAGSDDVAEAASVTIPAGQLSGQIRIAIQPDSLDEPNETFFVTLGSVVNAGIGDDQAVGTIIDND
jgi:hypothetical protein